LALFRSWAGNSNFRPAYAAYVYKKYCRGKAAKLLDISSGYGGRLVGAIASGVVVSGVVYRLHDCVLSSE